MGLSYYKEKDVAVLSSPNVVTAILQNMHKPVYFFSNAMGTYCYVTSTVPIGDIPKAMHETPMI